MTINWIYNWKLHVRFLVPWNAGHFLLNSVIEEGVSVVFQPITLNLSFKNHRLADPYCVLAKNWLIEIFTNDDEFYFWNYGLILQGLIA